MKNKYKQRVYFFGLIVILAVFFISCGDSNTVYESKYESKVVTERDLSTGKKTHVTEKHIVVLSLEHKDADANEYDLKEIGSDCFIIKPTKDLNNISLEIGEDATIGSLSIEDTISGEISTFTKDDEGATYSFKAGNFYEYCVTHDGFEKEDQAHFIRFESDESQDSKLRFNQDDIDTLKLTKSCTDCDLRGAILTFLQLPEANLSGAHLNDASLFGTNLTNADLRGTHLSSVNLEEATLDYATIDYDNFTFKSITNASFVGTTITGNFPAPENATKPAYAGINFSAANLSGLDIESITFDSNCTFRYTDFSKAYLNGAVFSYVNLAGAIFTDASISSTDFTKANLSNATWTNGRKCLEGSVGKCLDESDSNTGDGWYNFSDPFLIGDIGANSGGGGIAMGDTDGDGKPNLVAFYIDYPSGENYGYYRVSTNIRSDGSVASWARFEIPGGFGMRDQGGGIAIGDTDGDGIPNLVVFYIYNPTGQNYGYYRVSSNIRSNGSVKGWTAPFNIPGWFGVGDGGGGIDIADTDHDGEPNLIVFHVWNHDGENAGYHRVSTNIRSDDGSVEGWTDLQESLPNIIGNYTSGAGIATGHVIRGDDVPLELFVFYIDNPSGENHGYYHRCEFYRYTGHASCYYPYEIPGWYGAFDSGAGMAMGDIDGSGYTNLIIYNITNPSGTNYGYYRIGYWDNLKFPILESENK